MIDLGSARRGDFASYQRATAHMESPLAVVDLGSLHHNATAMARRAGGKPIRVASKSVRCREIITSVLALPGYAGVLALTLAEAVWLAEEVADVVVGYPTADRTSLRLLAGDDRLADRVTLMVDSAAHLDFIEAAVEGVAGVPLRVCLDLDASLKVAAGLLHVGPRRSPAHSPRAMKSLAREVLERPGFRLVGMMAYEGQIAGVGDNVPGAPLRNRQIRAMQHVSRRELQDRRAAAVAAISAIAPLEFVNGGGTGSIETTLSEGAVTEVAAGSGLFGPALFDNYRGFDVRPAALFALSVVRRPSRRHATVLGGGWIASGAPGVDRLPTPVWPKGLRLTGLEGAGEAQTPVIGPGVSALGVGDRVWFRHAKAGELCEHVNELHLLDGDRVVAAAPTYRGEGRAFL